MGQDAAEKMVSESGEAEFAAGIVEKIGLARAVPQRDMGVTAISGQMHKRFRHKGGTQPMLLGELFDHEFEEHVAICSDERIVIGPVHLELAVCILVITLVGPPAKAQSEASPGPNAPVWCCGKIRFASDSPLEEGGFEPSAPLAKRGGLSSGSGSAFKAKRLSLECR